MSQFTEIALAESMKQSTSPINTDSPKSVNGDAADENKKTGLSFFDKKNKDKNEDIKMWKLFWRIRIRMRSPHRRRTKRAEVYHFFGTKKGIKIKIRKRQKPHKMQHQQLNYYEDVEVYYVNMSHNLFNFIPRHYN